MASPIHSRVEFFLGAASWFSVLKIDNLVRRRHVLSDVCLLCIQNGESVAHLLIYCNFASEIWAEVLADFGLSWVMPRDPRALGKG